MHGDPVTVAGERYEAEVPDTLDLADRARLALNVLTRAVIPEEHFAYWQLMCLACNPPHFRWVEWVSKWLESMPRMRMMCGDGLNVGVEQGMMQAFVDRLGQQGLVWAPPTTSPGVRFSDTVSPLNCASGCPKTRAAISSPQGSMTSPSEVAPRCRSREKAWPSCQSSRRQSPPRSTGSISGTTTREVLPRGKTPRASLLTRRAGNRDGLTPRLLADLSTPATRRARQRGDRRAGRPRPPGESTRDSRRAATV